MCIYLYINTVTFKSSLKNRKNTTLLEPDALFNEHNVQRYSKLRLEIIAESADNRIILSITKYIQIKYRFQILHTYNKHTI